MFCCERGEGGGISPFVREKPTSRPHSGGEADPSPKQMTSFDPTDILIAQLTNRGMRLLLFGNRESSNRESNTIRRCSFRWKSMIENSSAKRMTAIVALLFPFVYIVYIPFSIRETHDRCSLCDGFFCLEFAQLDFDEIKSACLCVPIGREIVIPVSANFIKIHRDDREMIILKNVRNFEEFDIRRLWFFKKKG